MYPDLWTLVEWRYQRSGPLKCLKIFCSDFAQILGINSEWHSELIPWIWAKSEHFEICGKLRVNRRFFLKKKSVPILLKIAGSGRNAIPTWFWKFHEDRSTLKISAKITRFLKFLKVNFFFKVEKTLVRPIFDKKKKSRAQSPRRSERALLKKKVYFFFQS